MLIPAVWITLLNVLIAGLVSLLSIFLGYDLIKTGASAQGATASIEWLGVKVNLFNFLPGLFLAGFGCALTGWTVHRTTKNSSRN